MSSEQVSANCALTTTPHAINQRLRGNLDAKERELRLAKRALALAHEERAAAEAAVGTDKAYARKLEARLAASGGGAALREKHRQVRKQNALLHDEKAAQEAQLSAAENAVVEANREIATLRSALRIKSQELAAAPPGRTPAGATEAAAAAVGAAHGAASGEVTERLLYAVARAREESVILAVQLSERSQEVQNLKFELTKHVAELDEARQAREVTAREILALERKLAEVSGSSTRNESDATVLRTQLDGASKRAEASGREVLRLREAVEEARDALAAEKHRNLTHVSELQEATASSRRTLEKELTAARREMQEAKAAHAAEMGSLRGSCDELRLEALELKGKLSRDTARPLQASPGRCLDAVPGALATPQPSRPLHVRKTWWLHDKEDENPACRSSPSSSRATASCSRSARSSRAASRSSPCRTPPARWT